MRNLLLAWLLGVNFYVAPVLSQQKPIGIQDAATQISHQLRANHSTERVVELTAVAVNLLGSFVNDEQAIEQWRAALASDSEKDISHTYIHINSRALAGQVLTAYTSGMTLDEWRLIRLQKEPALEDLRGDIAQADVFRIYVNLSFYWQLILQEAAKTQNIDWFERMLGLSIAAPTDLDITQVDVTVSQLSEVLELLTDPSEKSLLTFLKKNDEIGGHLDDLSIALLRLFQHKQSDQLLASIYDWVNIYQRLEFSQQLMPSIDQARLLQLTQVYGLWYATELDRLNQIDGRLKPLIDALFSGISLKLKNPDHMNLLTNQMIFELITGISDMQSYVLQPFRTSLQRQLEVCINISDEFPPYPQQPIHIDQFSGCIEDMLEWGTTLARSADLSGGDTELTSTQPILRALELVDWQLINTLKKTHDTSACGSSNRVVNPLEWILAAESLLWLHDRWPGLFESKDLTAKFEPFIDAGLAIQMDIDCPESSKQLEQQYDQLVKQWQKIRVEVEAYTDQFAANRIKPGRSIDFFQSTQQFTGLQAQDYTISSCDINTSCGAQIELPASNELLSQFPNHVRQAVVLGLGEIDLCYDSVEWVNKRALETHLKNDTIANFEGQLSLNLKGRFNQELVFSKQVKTSQRYIYLFGENTQEVLDMSCPLSIVGKQIAAQLKEGTYGLFPNRLTFLTASRSDVNQIISNNWESGDEWLAKLSNESASELLAFNDLSNIETTVNSTFIENARELQEQIYQQLMESKLRRYNSSSLTAAMLDYLAQRNLFAATVFTLYPNQYHQNPKIRQALEGFNRLPDPFSMQRSFNRREHVIEMLNRFDLQIQEHKGIWQFEVEDKQYQIIEETINRLRQVTVTRQQNVALN